MKRLWIILFLLIVFACDSLPSKEDYDYWVVEQYHEETGNYAHHTSILTWERTEKDIREKYEGLDGYEVESIIVTYPFNMHWEELDKALEDGTLSKEKTANETTFHYIWSTYSVISKRWTMIGNSWGTGDDTGFNKECILQAAQWKADWVKENID